MGWMDRMSLFLYLFNPRVQGKKLERTRGEQLKPNYFFSWFQISPLLALILARVIWNQTIFSWFQISSLLAFILAGEFWNQPHLSWFQISPLSLIWNQPYRAHFSTCPTSEDGAGTQSYQFLLHWSVIFNFSFVNQETECTKKIVC